MNGYINDIEHSQNFLFLKIKLGDFFDMRIVITLEKQNSPIILPIHHNAIIQSAIYSSLSPNLASFFHDAGYIIDKRQFKLFTFSRLLGKYTINTNDSTIEFESPIQLLISSPIHEFIHDLMENVLQRGMRFGNQFLTVNKIEIEKPIVMRDRITVQTLSPVVVYSTMLRHDGRKYTAYFEPHEDDFKEILLNNLRLKGKALYKDAVHFGDVDIQPIGVHKRHIFKYIKKGTETIIKGYSGRFEIVGDRRLLQTAIEVGIGSKNSMGCGMVEMLFPSIS